VLLTTALAGATVLAFLGGLVAPARAQTLKSSIQSKSFGLPEGGGIVHVTGNLQNDDPTSFVVLTEVHVFNGPNEVPVTGGLLGSLATTTPDPGDFITLEPNTPLGNPNSFFPSPAGGELLTFTWKTPATATLLVSGYTYTGTPPEPPPPSDLLGTFTFQIGVTAPEPPALGLLALGIGVPATLRHLSGRMPRRRG
jgi:hypothetical protein